MRHAYTCLILFVESQCAILSVLQFIELTESAGKNVSLPYYYALYLEVKLITFQLYLLLYLLYSYTLLVLSAVSNAFQLHYM